MVPAGPRAARRRRLVAMSEGDGGRDGLVGATDGDGDERERVLGEVELRALGRARVGRGGLGPLLQPAGALAAVLLGEAAGARPLDGVEDLVGAPLQVRGPGGVRGGELVSGPL